MHLIIFGPHGSGKGTQAEKISQHYGIVRVTTGDIFRENIGKGTLLGKRAKKYMESNVYVPDQVTNGMVKERLQRADCKNGFILDGYPRTLNQVKFLDKLLGKLKVKLDAVVNLQVGEDEVVKRLLKRARNTDDTEEGIRKRAKEYEIKAKPVLNYYKKKSKVVDVNGGQTIDKVFQDIKTILDKVQKIERTLVIVKPDGVKRKLTDEIVRRYEAAGLKVVAMKKVEASSSMLSLHYSAHVKKPFYKGLVKFMTEGPVAAMIVEGENAVARVREITGVTDPSRAQKGTIRGDLGDDSTERADKEGRAIRNLVHASGSKEEAEKEIKLWFG
ncbi:MAG: adenylate kinase [Candidatus Aenigmarchaeota archaeon]|nr:adenylate kinase [Candidatus Aenigmarchaeota archaeon]